MNIRTKNDIYYYFSNFSFNPSCKYSHFIAGVNLHLSFSGSVCWLKMTAYALYREDFQLNFRSKRKQVYTSVKLFCIDIQQLCIYEVFK